MIDHRHITLRHLFSHRSSSPEGEAVRYVIAGCLAFGIDFVLLKVFTDYVGLHYLLSAVIGYIAGVVANYVMSTRWVFGRRKLGRPWAEFVIFVLIGVVGLALTSLLMWLFTDKAGFYYLVSKILTTLTVTVWNFTARKFILF